MDSSIAEIGSEFTIRDYIDIDDVLSVYKRFGIIIDETCGNRIRELCSIQISDFASKKYLDYANPKPVAELIVTGLLLG